MRKLLLLGVLALAGCCFWGENENEPASAVSPDGRNEIRLWTSPLAYEVRRGGTVVVAKSEIGMKVDGKCLNCGGEDAPAPIVERHVVSGTVETPVYKKNRIDLSGNEAFALRRVTMALRIALRRRCRAGLRSTARRRL